MLLTENCFGKTLARFNNIEQWLHISTLKLKHEWMAIVCHRIINKILTRVCFLFCRLIHREAVHFWWFFWAKLMTVSERLGQTPSIRAMRNKQFQYVHYYQLNKVIITTTTSCPVKFHMYTGHITLARAGRGLHALYTYEILQDRLGCLASCSSHLVLARFLRHDVVKLLFQLDRK